MQEVVGGTYCGGVSEGGKDHGVGGRVGEHKDVNYVMPAGGVGLVGVDKRGRT